jgi:hypothetical protein
LFNHIRQTFMKLHHIAFGVLLAAIAGCSSPSSPTVQAVYASREYDPRLGGVQITRIYYDEQANQKADGSLNEYIILQGPDSISLSKWALDAGQGEILPLSGMLYRTLTIYTAPEGGAPSRFSASFSRTSWMWAEHDTAKLIDNNKAIRSALAY